MNFYSIKVKKKILLEVYSFLDYSTNFKTEKKFIENLLKEDKNFASTKSKELIRKKIFSNSNINDLKKNNFEFQSIKKIITNFANKTEKYLNQKPLKIFIFPTFSERTNKIMKGIQGTTINKNKITIYLHPKKNIHWKKTLENCLFHEYAHAFYWNYHKFLSNFLTELIYEGIAEHFREHMLSKPESNFVKEFTEKECKLFLKKTKNKLNTPFTKLIPYIKNKEKNTYWMLYSSGHLIVKKFIENNKNLNWEEIMTLSPEQILEKSKIQEYINQI